MISFKKAAPFLLLLSFLIQAGSHAWITGQTTDETFYNGSGMPMVRYNNYSALGEHPPLIMQLGSLPLLLTQVHFPIAEMVKLADNEMGVDLSKTGAKFLYQSGNDAQFILRAERAVIIALALTLGYFLYLWSLKLFGFPGALISLALFSFCPNMIAHGSLFTTDMGLTAFFFIFFYFLDSFFTRRRKSDLILAAVFAGLAFLSKISALGLVPALAFILFLNSCREQERSSFPGTAFLASLSLLSLAVAIKQKSILAAAGPLCFFNLFAYCEHRFETKAVLKWGSRLLLVAGLMALFIYVLGSENRGGLMRAATAGWFAVTALLSAFFLYLKKERGLDSIRIFSFILFVSLFVITLGYTDFYRHLASFDFFFNYLRSFNIAAAHTRLTHALCLPGSLIHCDWRYFISVIGIKTPMLTLFLSILGIGGLLRMPISLVRKGTVLAPLFVFLFMASFFNKINIGLRHVLPVYPFLFLLAGYAGWAMSRLSPPALKKAAFGFVTLLVAATAGRTVSAAPHYLSYFTEWVGGPEQGKNYVIDSNLDWGQDNKRFADYVLSNKLPQVKIYFMHVNAEMFSYYGLPWSQMTSDEIIAPPKGTYALSIGVYQTLPPDSWFYQRKPDKVIGTTVYVFNHA